MADSALPYLILITGAPGTGKTALGERLGDRLGLPFVWKDGIKETLMDFLGYEDVVWSQKLGVASIKVLYHLLEVQLKARASFIIECNFRADLDTPQLLALQQRYPFQPIQICLYADTAVLRERNRVRAASGARHPGHHDMVRLEGNAPPELKITRASEFIPLDIGGHLFEIDTTDFAAVDYAGLFGQIEGMRKMAG